MNCSKHSWLMGSQEIRPNVVVIVRQCANCGEVQLVWGEGAPASVEMAKQQVEETRQVVQRFHDILKEAYAKNYQEACKQPAGLGYAWGGILYYSLLAAFDRFGIKLNL